MKLAPTIFIKDIFLTTATLVATAICNVLVMRILAERLGTNEFGIYALARQVFIIASTVSTLAMGVAITRYVAISKSDNDRLGYLLSGLFISMMASLLICGGGVLYRSELAVSIFHDEAQTQVFLASLFIVFSYSCYTALYAYYRGIGSMSKANVWHFTVAGLLPLLIVIGFAGNDQLELVLLLLGASYLSSLIVLAALLIKAVRTRIGLGWTRHLNELFQYGLGRVWGGVILALLASYTMLLAPYYGTVADAGYLFAGFSIFALMETGIAAFGLVILPKIAQLHSDNNVAVLQDRIADVVVFVVHIGTFTTLHFSIWAEQIITVWLGQDYSQAAIFVRIYVLALIPYMAYVMTRSIIDAVDTRAVNARNLVVALLTALVASFALAEIGLGVPGLALGATIGFLALGLVTIRYLYLSGYITRLSLEFRGVLILNLTIAGSAVLLKFGLFDDNIGAFSLFGIGVFEGCLFLLYLVGLRRLKVGWLETLAQRLVRDKR